MPIEQLSLFNSNEDNLTLANSINDQTLQRWNNPKIHAKKVIARRFHKIVLPFYEVVQEKLNSQGIQYPSRAVADYIRLILHESQNDVIKDIASSFPQIEEQYFKRSPAGQAIAKNSGELFAALVSYNLAKNLQNTGWAVHLGIPHDLKPYLSVNKLAGTKKYKMLIESDLTVFQPGNLLSSPIFALSLKTTLKERLHIATMWRLLLAIVQNEELCTQLEIQPFLARETAMPILQNIKYCFVTADVTKDNVVGGQGSDLIKPRELINAEAALFDYMFVARHDIEHIPEEITDRSLFQRLSSIYEILEKVLDNSFG